MRYGGDAASAVQDVGEDELHRGVRRGMVRSPRQEKRRLGLALMGDRDGLAVLCLRHAERLAGHRREACVAGFVRVVARVMGRVANAPVGVLIAAQLEDGR